MWLIVKRNIVMSESAGENKIILAILAVLCFLLMVAGVVFCAVGYESFSTGINPTSWIMTLVVMVIMPFVVIVIAVIGILKQKN